MWEFLNKAAVLNQLMTPEKWAITFIANNRLYRPVQYILPLLLNCVFHAHTPSTTFWHLPPKTLPDLVMPLKGHSLSPRRCPATRTAPSERFRYKYDCRSNLVPKHTRKHEMHPPRVKKRKRFRLESNDCGFICAGVNFVGGYKWHTFLFELFVTNWLLLISWQFSGPYCITKYGSGWRKDVVNQCLEFVSCHVAIHMLHEGK